MNILEFSDYKTYLRQYMRSRPKGGRGETLRIAEALSVHSTLVSQVLRGPKDFTLEQARAICDYVGLIGLEADYFITLVQIERAGTKKLREYFQEKLSHIRKNSLQLSRRVSHERELTDQEKAQFYSSWLYSGVRQMTSIEGFQTVDRIADHLDLPPLKVAEILHFLVRCGLCIESGGRYELGVRRTHIGSESPFLNQHRLNWHVKAMERTARLSNEELIFTCPASINEKDFHIFREELVILIKRFYDLIKEPKADRLSCLNIDWFFVVK